MDTKNKLTPSYSYPIIDFAYIGHLFLHLLQLLLIWYLVLSLNIESDLWLERFLPLVIIFFPIHALIPIKYKPIVFLISFLCTILLFLGFQDVVVLLTMGLGIFGICHLPISLNIRKTTVFIIATLLGLGRLGYIWSPLSSHGLTVFAAIFMFRTIVYLYELKYEKESASIWQRLNYFFLLPNIIFPLFPIVDYKTYLSTYYNKPATFIYQRGINLILWSIICLLVYRWIYYFAIPNTENLDGVFSVSQYVIATYLTVIRLVGILSLSVGVLRLFGYNLPDIFNYMFLASSFADLFRRINIYWKTFLMKICYYPVYFKLRKITPKHALLLSALVTFFFTWFFHIYQWAWILGSNPIRPTSILYWGIFGVLATMSMMMEKKRRKPAKTFGGTLIHAAKVVGVFISIALLYSMWTQARIEQWLDIVQIAFLDEWVNWLGLFAIIIGAIIVVGLGFYIYRNYIEHRQWTMDTPLFSYLSLGLLYLAFFAFIEGSNDDKMIAFAEGEVLNENDSTTEYEGYYEDILKVDISSKLWDDQIHSFLISKNWTDIFIFQFIMDTWRQTSKSLTKNAEPEDLGLSFSKHEFTKSTDNVLRVEMLPNQKVAYKGKRFSTNQWGMRDKEYEKIPPQNTIRIALLGGSPTMGSGVHDEEVFEALTEKKLNDSFGNDSLQLEILNFAIGSGAQTFQLAYLLEQKVVEFQPDYVILVDHFSKERIMFNKIKQILRDDKTIYPEFEQILQSQGITKDATITPEKMVESENFIKEWSIYHFAGVCKKNNIQPILAYYPSLGPASNLRKYKLTLQEAGFRIMDLESAFDGYSKKELHVSAHDRHPNALAHQLLSDKLYEELAEYLRLK